MNPTMEKREIESDGERDGYLQSFYKDTFVNLMAFVSHQIPAESKGYGCFHDHIAHRDHLSVKLYRCDLAYCPAVMCRVEIAVKPKSEGTSPGSASLQSPQSPRSRKRDRELAFETIEDDDDEEDLEDDQERAELVRRISREIFEASELQLEPLHQKTVVFNSEARSVFLRPISCNAPLPTEDVITDPFSGYGLWRTVDTNRRPSICTDDVFKIVQLFYFNDHPHGNDGTWYGDCSLADYGYVDDEASSIPNDSACDTKTGTAATTEYAMDPFDNYRCWHLIDLVKYSPAWLIYLYGPTRKIRKKLQIFYLRDDAGDATEVEHLSEEEVCDNIYFGDGDATEVEHLRKEKICGSINLRSTS